MHILVMTMNYAPEKTAGRPRTELCEYLTSVGHRVSVVTAFPHYPEWRIHEGYRGKLFQREVINGVEIYRVIHFIPRNPKQLFQRLVYEATFAINAFGASFLARDVDLVLYAGAQPAAAAAACMVARLRRVPYVVKITDLMANVAESLKVVKSHALAGLLRAFEYSVYRQAVAAIVLCEGFANELARYGLDRDRIHIIHDSADLQAIRPLDRDRHLRGEMGLEETDFVVLYSGSMAMKQGLDLAIHAAARSSQQSDIKWVLVGEGVERAKLVELSRALNVHDRVLFLPFQPLEKFPSILAEANVLLLTQRSEVIDAVIPSKLMTYMAAGRAIAVSVNAESESARLIQRAECGVIVPPEDPEALARAVIELKSSPGRVVSLGKNARAFAELRFDRERVLSAQASLLTKIAASQQ